LIIGLHAAAGSGKDTFFKTIKEQYPHLDVRKVAYADPIRIKVSEIFNLKNETEYDVFKRSSVTWQGKEIPGREIVRGIGMLMREYDQDQFVQYVDDTINIAPNACWFITDVRFHNELEHKKRREFPLVKIKRSGVSYDGHQSEMEIADHHCDAIIYNSNIEQYAQDACKTFELFSKTK